MAINNPFISGDPYSYDLNWQVRAIKQLAENVESIKDLQFIHYANPFQWDIRTQYPKNTMTLDANSGNVYLSVTDVPNGITLDNHEYWTLVFNYETVFSNIEEQIGTREDTNIASKDYEVGDLVWVNDILYTCVATISEGDTFTVGGNIAHSSISDLLKNYRANTIDYTADESISLSAPEIEINGDTLDINSDLKYKTPTPYDGVHKTVPLKDENNNTYNLLAVDGSYNLTDIDSGSMIFVGDSFMRGVGASLETGLAYQLAYRFGKTIGVDAYNMSEGSCGFVAYSPYKSFQQIMEQHETEVADKSKVTGVVIVGGTNDILRPSSVYTQLDNAINNLVNYIRGKYPNAKIAYVSNLMSYGDAVATDYTKFMTIFEEYFEAKKVQYIGNGGNYLKKLFLKGKVTGNNYLADDIHPNADGYALFASWIYSASKGSCSNHNVSNAPVNLNGVAQANCMAKCEIVGDTFRLYETQPIYAGSANYNMGNATGDVNNLYIATSKFRSFLGSSNATAWYPYCIGYGIGFLYDGTKWFTANLRFILRHDGAVDVYATAANGSGFVNVSSPVVAGFMQLNVTCDVGMTRAIV